MEFLGDQGRDVVIVSNFLKHFDLMFIGPQTSIGNMYLGPFYYYLMAPFLLMFNYSPVGPAVMVVLFALATTYLIYYVYLKLFKNHLFALLSSLLYAISPVAIKYSNFSWNPNIMPFFALAFFYISYQVIFLKKYKLLPILAICFSMALNSHYLALILVPIFFFYLLINTYQTKNNLLVIFKQNIKPLLYSLLVLLIFLSPLILFDLKHNGQNIKSIYSFFAYRQTTVNLKAYKALPQIVPLWTQINTRLLFGKNQTMGSITSIVFLVFLCLSLLKKSSNRQNIFILASYIFISIIALGLYKQHIYDHYFGFMFPIIFMLFSALIQTLFPVKFFRPFLVLLLTSSIYLSFIQNPLHFPAPNQLANTRQISSLILDQSKGLPFNLALLAKNNYDPPYRYFLDLYNAPLYHLKDQKTDQLFVICEPNPELDCNPEGNPLWDIAAFGIAKVESTWHTNGVVIYKMVSY